MAQLRTTAPMITRPSDTTAYASGDLVANSTTAGSVVPLTFSFARDDLPNREIQIRSASIVASGTTITSKALRLHLFQTLPTFVTGGDNSAISTVVATGAAGYIGSIDVTAMQAIADGSFGVGAPLAGSEIVWEAKGTVAANGTIPLYGILEARGAFTPATGETITVTITGLPVIGS